MKTNISICIAMLLLSGCASSSKNETLSARDEPLLAATPEVKQYASTTVLPRLDDKRDRDILAQLILVSKTLIDPKDGVSINKMEPGKFMVYDMLSKAGLGAVSTIGLSPVQKQTLGRWRTKYMQTNPADVFFAPSGDEIIGTRAAFGCTHYARAFMAVVKALGLIDRPEDLRYVISSKADDYNRALENQDVGATINGHQFVIARIDSRWIAINTSKGESAPLPAGFNPNDCAPPRNIPVRFHSYPDIVFLLRRIGADWDDGCGDNSLSALMNISGEGWRVPTIEELYGIVEQECENPAVNSIVFPDIRDLGGGAPYWTVTRIEEMPMLVYFVDFISGRVDGHSEGFTMAVRLVRNQQ